MPAEDLWTYEKIGKKGTEITGYPAISVYHDFRYHPRKVITGTFNDWLYDQMGAFGWVVEIWSPQQQAGIEEYDHIDWDREHPLEDDLKMLKWSDEVLEGKGYVDWYPFDHPQLGPGGAGRLELSAMPSGTRHRRFLEKEIAPFADWLVWHLLISPRLELYDVSVKALGEDAYHVRLVVQNTGWLPTYVTKKALEKKLVRGCSVRDRTARSGDAGERRAEAGGGPVGGPGLQALGPGRIQPWGPHGGPRQGGMGGARAWRWHCKAESPPRARRPRNCGGGTPVGGGR